MLSPLAIIAGFFALTLLNQEYGWLPAQMGIYDIQVNGYLVANTTMIWALSAIGVSMVSVSIILWVVSFRNWRANRSLV